MTRVAAKALTQTPAPPHQTRKKRQAIMAALPLPGSAQLPTKLELLPWTSCKVSLAQQIIWDPFPSRIFLDFCCPCSLFWTSCKVNLADEPIQLELPPWTSCKVKPIWPIKPPGTLFSLTSLFIFLVLAHCSGHPAKSHWLRDSVQVSNLMMFLPHMCFDPCINVLLQDA